MDDDELETNEQSIANGVDLVDRLLGIADGERAIVVGEYNASTILALLMDKKYRIEVMSRLDDFAGRNLE